MNVRTKAARFRELLGEGTGLSGTVHEMKAKASLISSKAKKTATSGVHLYFNYKSILSHRSPSAVVKIMQGPGQVAQVGRALSQYTMVVGSIPGQGTYRKQPMSASTRETPAPVGTISTTDSVGSPS